ncbi:BadM/Rrf2 family transcriptional regulator [Novosphingobium kunmingense]|uniref:BadM/Rrf2 family transcriptional regulator n=1 Tax=Novosphingobium kunmingense TaxID=1211806 RepID=A0A2N0H4W1_9SPHN|nr:SUF system Fe-S cluster assembly regulator [Novosphingobium kunmingense]PKB13972.1 BadM/Rrf2 family transcriptional regulator [Novosphingobium kunmingense]
MRLSNMADYAVLTMSAAARHCGGARVAAAQLAEETGLPVPTVQKLVSRLTAAGLLRSSRGVGGGLKLARPAAAITLADIVEAVDGPIALAPCSDEAHDCRHEESCSVKPYWADASLALRGALSAVPLTRLAETAR